MVYRLSSFQRRSLWKKITTKIYNDKTFTKKENYLSSIKSISLDLLFISFLRYSQFNLPNCLGQDVDPGIWPYHLFRVDCLVSIYGRSWVGKLFVGEDNRQNRETIIDIRKNRNPDWDISRISFYTHYADAHNNLGAALSAERKNEEAITHYKMAIKIKPDFAAAQKNLETALLRSEELE